MNREGVVVKKLANDFWVKCNNNIFVCKPRGTLKSSGIFVGDNVSITIDNTNTIDKIFERKNLLIRPPLANLDQLIIVISPIPKPDFMIVDKLILFCYSHGIKPVLVVNKQDLSCELNNYVLSNYSTFIETLFVSAKTSENLALLTSVLKGRLSAFAGQSAVGKSALINSLFQDKNAIEGELSKKINRGKNTTRHCEIFYNKDFMIADTAGFTSLDENLLLIPYYELALYYPDYNKYKHECRYSSCAHYNEPEKDCKIKQLVKVDKLDQERYNRYRKLYESLEQRWVKTHG